VWKLTAQPVIAPIGSIATGDGTLPVAPGSTSFCHASMSALGTRGFWHHRPTGQGQVVL